MRISGLGMVNAALWLAACGNPTEGNPATPGRPTDGTGIGQDEATCTLEPVPLAPVAGPAGAFIAPVAMTISLDGLFAGGLPYDFAADLDSNGTVEAVSATVTFHMLDRDDTELCAVTFDASSSTRASAWDTSSGGAVSATFGLVLDPAFSASTCPPLDPLVYGRGTVAEVLAQLPIELGIGQLLGLSSLVQSDLTLAGENYAIDWLPYVLGVYYKGAGTIGTEIGYARGAEVSCDQVVGDGTNFLTPPAPGADLPRGRYVGYAYKSVPFSGSGGVITETTVTDPTVPDGELVGSYEIEDGPDWHNNPPTYNCLEACAEVFGGVATDYQCSTRPDLINNQAFVSGYGDASYCTSPVAEDYKLNTNYNCGSTGCAYSAYVLDNCNSSEKNFCWK